MAGVSIFIAVVSKNKDQSFKITYPDINNCTANVKSENLIIQAGQKALAIWFDEKNYVRPSPLHVVRRLETVQTAIEKGAKLVAIHYQGPTSF